MMATTPAATKPAVISVRNLMMRFGSQTVLAIGPAPKSAVDAITGHLSLL